METGLFILRVVVGLALAAHGSQKLFGMFGGPGLAGTGGFFEALGFRPGKPFAAMAGLGEAGGGLALALGVLTPLSAAVVLATMLVAMSAHSGKGFFAQNGGYEYALIIAAAAAALAFTGPGGFSIDAALGLSLSGPKWGLIAIGLAAVGALPPLAMRFAFLGRRTTTTAAEGAVKGEGRARA
jgi:putative oxidoreductase